MTVKKTHVNFPAPLPADDAATTTKQARQTNREEEEEEEERTVTSKISTLSLSDQRSCLSVAHVCASVR